MEMKATGTIALVLATLAVASCRTRLDTVAEAYSLCTPEVARIVVSIDCRLPGMQPKDFALYLPREFKSDDVVSPIRLRQFDPPVG
jgi:hypothetical protein